MAWLLVWVWGMEGDVLTSVPSNRPESAILPPMSTAVARPFPKALASVAGTALVVTGTEVVVVVVTYWEVAFSSLSRGGTTSAVERSTSEFCTESVTAAFPEMSSSVATPLASSTPSVAEPEPPFSRLPKASPLGRLGRLGKPPLLLPALLPAAALGVSGAEVVAATPLVGEGVLGARVGGGVGAGVALVGAGVALVVGAGVR